MTVFRRKARQEVRRAEAAVVALGLVHRHKVSGRLQVSVHRREGDPPYGNTGVLGAMTDISCKAVLLVPR